MMTMIKKTLMQWLVLLAGAQKIYQARNLYKDMTHLKFTMAYLKFVKTSRLLFISFMGMGACLVLLLCSIIVFQFVLFIYVPWSPETKMWVGFGCAAVYFLVAASAFFYLFGEDKWLKIFNADGMVNGAAPRAPARQELHQGGNHG